MSVTAPITPRSMSFVYLICYGRGAIILPLYNGAFLRARCSTFCPPAPSLTSQLSSLLAYTIARSRKGMYLLLLPSKEISDVDM